MDNDLPRIRVVLLVTVIVLRCLILYPLAAQTDSPSAAFPLDIVTGELEIPARKILLLVSPASSVDWIPGLKGMKTAPARARYCVKTDVG